MAALFFYPLAAALADNPFYLQWQRRDAFEVAAAWPVLALMFGTGVYYAWPRLTRRGNAVLAAVAAIPLASLTGGVLQQLPFDAALIHAWENAVLRYGLPVAIVALLLAAFLRWPSAFGRWLRRTLLAVSLVSLVVVRAVVASAFYPPTPVTIDRSVVTEQHGACTTVVALLFDELSFSYLYDGGEIGPAFSSLRRLGAGATHYLHVTAPAHETLVSLPGYLASRSFRDVRVEPTGLVEIENDGDALPFSAAGSDSLFATARRLGFHTEMAGYYLPYCALLGVLVDTCQSLSFYNASGVDDSFSPLHPIATTLILWPRQFPFGLVKNRPFSRLQRDLVGRTLAFAQRPVDPRSPTFRFVHFSVPHLPFVFDGSGFNPPLDPLRTDPDVEYARQIQYVDRLVGEIVARMQRDGSFDRTTLVILSDHGFRFGGRDADPLHIPFIVKEAGQRTRADRNEPLQGAQLLRDLVINACGQAH